MLVPKEVIRPGQYWYTDPTTQLPRKLTVTPELVKYWHEQGNKMLAAGLTVPVPYEHDSNSHPMTPKDKLLNNAGWVKEYQLKDNTLYGVVDVQDDKIAEKLPKTIRWTSPWISSFTDGQGNQWNNVISHLALTTRPRIVKQAPFTSIAAALSIASPTEVKTDASPASAPTGTDTRGLSGDGFWLSRAGRLVERKKDKKLCPQFPMAFSLMSGARFDSSDGEPTDLNTLDDEGEEPKETETPDLSKMMNPLAEKTGDVKMEEMLCDLLSALGIQMPENCSEHEFKRCLYEATMNKIKELTSAAQSMTDQAAANPTTGTSPSAQSQQPNPIIQQEQQPMYMSLDEINKIPDPTMKNIALSMYNENIKLRAEMEAEKKRTDSLRDAKLTEERTKRDHRCAMLSKVSPKVKTDLEEMLKKPEMALSLGDGGNVIDPMSAMLTMLEKGLGDMPRLLTTPSAALSIVPQPTDENALKPEEEEKIVDDYARMMGAVPQQKAS